MRKFERIKSCILSIAVITLIVLVFLIMSMIRTIEGNTRVVNYIGIVRGGTQRLIKQEIMGYENDDQIKYLNNIMNELRTGEGQYGLNRLDDEKYQEGMEELCAQWSQLKQSIYRAREYGLEDTELYEQSETYFALADRTVHDAEIYSEGIVASMANLEIVVIGNVVIVIVLMIYNGYDAIILSRANKRLRNMAYVDSNTGLPNKRSCERQLGSDEVPDKGQEVCCIMFDLNNLKLVNDTMGHKIGDRLILEFARILKVSAPEKMFIGRYGGDEFIGVARDFTRVEAEEFLGILADNVQEFNGQRYGVSISYACGYAMSSDYKKHTIRMLMDMADKEMYKSKSEIKHTMRHKMENRAVIIKVDEPEHGCEGMPDGQVPMDMVTVKNMMGDETVLYIEESIMWEQKLDEGSVIYLSDYTKN